jgi:hypothetical protein
MAVKDMTVEELKAKFVAFLKNPSPAVAKKSPEWSPWIGVGFGLLAIFVMRFTGLGLRVATIGLVAGVVFAWMLYHHITDKSKRIWLLIVPAIISLVLFFVYLSLPHGMAPSGASFTNPYKDQTSESNGEMFGNAYGNGSDQSDTDQGYDSGGNQIEGDPAHNDRACNTVEGCDPQMQGSQPEATTAPGYPTAEMPEAERLALWAELNPVENMEENPTADSSNDEWLDFVNYCLHRVQTSPYHPNHGEYWMSFGAVADPYGPLVVKPIPGRTHYQYDTWIDSATDWVGDEGDTERSFTADVSDNNGDYREGVKVDLKLVEINNTGRYVVLADLVS